MLSENSIKILKLRFCSTKYLFIMVLKLLRRKLLESNKNIFKSYTASRLTGHIFKTEAYFREIHMKASKRK